MLLYAALFICLLNLQSCAPSESVIQGSFDFSNEREGGVSKLKNGDDVGYNVALELNFGLNGVGTGPIQRESLGEPIRDGEVYPRENFAKEPSSSGKFMLGTTLQLIRKGSKFQETKTHLQYIEVLGDVLYYAPMKSGGTLFGGLGPYIGYGIGGNVSAGGTKFSAFGGDDGYKRFDAGLHLTAGYALPSTLQFSLGYEFGLVNKSPADDFTSKNRTLSFNVGYSLEKIIHGFRKK